MRRNLIKHFIADNWLELCLAGGTLIVIGLVAYRLIFAVAMVMEF